MKAFGLDNGAVELRKPKLGGRNGGGIDVRGIEVQEEELSAIRAQTLYKLRCECGRSWFELELPRLVKCPACDRLGLVST
jgi:hypothetical protein